ncbi:HAD family hydrolase [Opitutaceae bacterium TAV5]|nr:HAD family hydrolase [Opitutaceae bacterium TAV5]
MPTLPENIRGILADLDGTLYVGQTAIPGAIEALHRIRERGLGIRYLTNTTSKPRSVIAGQLHRLGLPVEIAHLYTAPCVARDHLLAAGMVRCHCLLPADVIADMEGITHVDTHPQAVVVGDMGGGISGEALNRAFRFLLDGAAFFTLARNRCYRAADGLRLDVGAFTAALEYGTRREATLLGKPAPHFFRAPLDDLGLQPDEALMIGDDLESDVGGAQAIGLYGVLVRTGKFSEEELQKSSVRPDVVIDSFADLAG